MAEDILNRKIELVVVGGSAGSLEVILKILPQLTEPLHIALVIVLHRKSSADSTLLELLSARTKLTVTEIEDKDPMLPGNIYLAPADYHLLFEHDHTFSLDASEKINYSRPSLDVAFESAGDIYGPSMAGIILSGANADGTQGLKSVRQAGGITIAQEPATAQVPFMPQQAIQHVPVDIILNADEMTHFINNLKTKE